MAVKFREGKKCESATEAPTGFKVDKGQGCYVTDFLPMGGTASLRFQESEMYNYEVTWEGRKDVVHNGVIVVR